MSKYTFERIGAQRFEAMAQALLEKRCRTGGVLVQFGDGKDGAREATWTQPVDHPDYVRPKNETLNVEKEWVFQVKYHDIGLRGWEGARTAIENDLARELDKLITKYAVPCHKYILITNVPFTGARNVGTRDRVNFVIRNWKHRIPEIEVWDASDLSRMLDADTGVRTTYLGDILPGDVLQALLNGATSTLSRRDSAFHAYLKALLRTERDAKTDEAGDEEGLELAKIFVDLDLRLLRESRYPDVLRMIQDMPPSSDVAETDDGRTQDPTWRASFVLFIAGHRSMLIKGGPGVGKSTLTQFATLYHAARMVDASLAIRLARRLKLPSGMSPRDLDCSCKLRFPIRIELRRYAQWMGDLSKRTGAPHLARYVADRMSSAASADLTMDDVFALAASNPLLLILDGLDEVPHPETRATIFRELQTFLDRCEGETADVQLVLSSRPQGYRGEFDGFEPIEWEACDLRETDFAEYCEQWLEERVPDNDERCDAQRRIDEGMRSPAVQQLAKTLLQATVMLTIARQKHPIPHARHELFARYVTVIFDRERSKEMVRGRETELRRLHERVGYELLKRMERATIDSGEFRMDDFRAFVRDVMENYGPADLHGMTIGEVTDEIVTMAKDRLGLLAGKGDDQQSIDFVIQPFREYFAAQYMHGHEVADVDRVFHSLAIRDRFWGDVLQFYGAVQSRAQQKAWIGEIGAPTGAGDSVEESLSLIRKRRALLRLLPECQRPRNSDVEQAFRNILEYSTRWVWSGDNAMPSLLSAFSPDRAFSICAGIFGQCSLQDRATLRVELRILAILADNQDAAQFAFVKELLEKLLLDGDTIRIALEAILLNDVPIDISSMSTNIVESVLDETQFHQSMRDPERVAALLPEELVLAYSLRSFPLRAACASRVASSSDNWLGRAIAFISPPARDLNIRACQFTLASYASKRDSSVCPNKEVLSRLSSSLKPESRYVAALMYALLDPTNQVLDQAARDLAVKCDDRAIAREFSPENVLGPAPSSFSRDEDWKTFRKCFADVANAAIEDIAALEVLTETNFLPFFLFHPDDWRELEVDGLLAQDEVNAMRTTPLGEMLQMLPPCESPFVLRGFSANTRTFRAPQLCRAALRVTAKRGRSAMSRRSNILWIPMHTKASIWTCDNGIARELLSDATRSALPEAWAALTLRVCAAADDLDDSELLPFWNQICTPTIDAYTWERIPASDERICRLLDQGESHRVLLAAWLSRPEDESTSVDDQLDPVGRALSQVLSTSDLSDAHFELGFSLLLQRRSALNFTSVWRSNRIVRLIARREGHFWWRLMHVFVESLEGSLSAADKICRRETLHWIAANRTDYPPEIALGAIDGLLKLDEMATHPLEDSDWQLH